MKKKYLGIICSVALLATAVISPITANACDWGEQWGQGGNASWGGNCNPGGKDGGKDAGGTGKIDFGGGGGCNQGGKIDFGGGGNCNGGGDGKSDFGGAGKIDFGGGGNCNGGGTEKIDFGGGTGGTQNIDINNCDQFMKVIQSANVNININITASFTINCPIDIKNTVNITSTNGSCIKAGGDFCSGGKYEGCGMFNIDKGGMFNIGNGTGKCDFKIDQNTAPGPCINVKPAGGCEINGGISFINNGGKDAHQNSSCVIIKKEEESANVKIDTKVDVNGKTISNETFKKDFVDCNTKTDNKTDNKTDAKTDDKSDTAVKDAETTKEPTNTVPSINNKSASPQTGDEFPYAIVITVVVIALAGAVTTFIIIKKRKQQ